MATQVCDGASLRKRCSSSQGSSVSAESDPDRPSHSAHRLTVRSLVEVTETLIEDMLKVARIGGEMGVREMPILSPESLSAIRSVSDVVLKWA